MSDAAFETHLDRLKTAVLHGYSLTSIPRWIEERTFLGGRPFSFQDHEFQKRILQDISREVNVRKCSQIGLSELSARRALALVNILEGVIMIYTLPTANFAKTFAKTRLDPIVEGSATLRAAVHPTMDNTEVKQFNQSFIYIKGTVGTGAAISVPADFLTHDEVDFSDPEVLSNYQSRLTHSKYKGKMKLSTPTVEGYGISAEMAASRRYFNLVKCDHCAQHFLPDYFKHVRIPDFPGDSLREITQGNIHKWRVDEAFVECPHCGGKPSLQPEYREWVLENPDATFEAAGYQIQPFDAPNIISCRDLIISSTKYRRYVDFVNFGLGMPAEDRESTLTKEDVDACYIPGRSPGFYTHVMGIDMGLMCHIVVSGVDHLGKMMTVHTEVVPLGRLEVRKNELCATYRVSLTVQDTQPYVETVMRMQKTDPNLFGAIFSNLKQMTPFSVKDQDKEPEEGKLDIRQVNVNRNRALDGLMGFIRSGNWFILEDENRALITKHLQDMKRVKDFTADNELAFVWRKSVAGDDHFHHALLYCWIASQMRGMSHAGLLMPGLVHSFKIKT
jgi:hypothetical protein